MDELSFMQKNSLHIPDESAMTALGERLAQSLRGEALIYLRGDLGAGKTTLTRAMIHALGFQGRVKSPTYTLVENYELLQQTKPQMLFHFDFYRISDAAELELIGLQEYFTQQAICIVEWPEHAFPLLPPADLFIHIDILENGRQVSITAAGPRGQGIWERFAHAV